jgi:hypothetical protein
MAWWTTQFIFQGEILISEGLEPPALRNLEWIVADSEDSGDKLSNGGERYTQVIVSGYALYGRLRGYYALGVAHWHLAQEGGRAFWNEASHRHSEPVASLTPSQRAIIRECLIRFDAEAWETSNASFRRQLEG